ncbi:MAG: energy-coupling factor transporter transmembrane protein EcfT [Treponemataceae bacterium]|nr:energy-coupling factor transporter transmembrane protein EcfT [Treponemataceae bacterium]
MHKITLNPIVLIIVNILAPSMYIFIGGTYLQYFLFAYASVVLISMGCLKNLGIFYLLYGLMEGLIFISRFIPILENFSLFLAVLIQSIPCFALVTVLIGKYNSAELLSALETMHIPRTLVVAVTITLKYVPTFRREFRYILESMRLRGISFTLKQPVRSFRYFVVPQLFRCAALAEEVTAAGLVKGIDAPMRRSSYYEQKIRFSDSFFLTFFLLGMIGGFIWFKK